MGSYVCEYKTYRVYPVGSPEESQLANEYDANEEGSYVISTAYPVPQFGARLCFDATRRYRDVGRLINHCSLTPNLKLGKPLFLRGKWRVGMIALRNVFVGQELTYDYGIRSEQWMKRSGKRSQATMSGGETRAGKGTRQGKGSAYGAEKTRAEQGEQGTKSQAVETRAGKAGHRMVSAADETTGQDVTEEIGGEDCGSVVSDDVQIVDPSTPSSSSSSHKRNYFWCPEVDCASGPVQKITQHLQKVHKMSPATAARIAKKKRRAPAEAVRLKTPNPHTRSSGLQHLPLYMSKVAKVSTTTGSSPATSTPAVCSTDPAASSDEPPTPLHIDISSGKLHEGGQFLDGVRQHLMTRAGGKRGDHAATQMTRYIGKYQFSLNPNTVMEDKLLDTAPVVPYLDAVQKAGIGSSGILHRILSHKAAIQYMRLVVSLFSVI